MKKSNKYLMLSILMLFLIVIYYIIIFNIDNTSVVYNEPFSTIIGLIIPFGMTLLGGWFSVKSKKASNYEINEKTQN